MVNRLFGRRSSAPAAETQRLAATSKRAETLVEESREHVVVLDADRRVLAASRRARQSLEGVVVGELLPARLLEASEGRDPLEIEYDVDGTRETLVYLGTPGDLAAYQELRAGFTAAVSHELRTPLARLLILVESLALPGADTDALASQARDEVVQIGELIDDVLFLSELESGRAVVSLGSTRALPVLEQILAARGERSANAGVTLRVDCPADLELLCGRGCSRRSLRISSTTRFAMRARAHRSPSASATKPPPSFSRGRTPGMGFRTRTCLASSNASSAPTVHGPLTAPGSAWPSSSTSSPRQAALRRRTPLQAAGSRSGAPFR